MILCKALFDTPKHISTFDAKTGVIFSLTFKKDGVGERLRGVGREIERGGGEIERGGGELSPLSPYTFSYVLHTHITVYNNIKMDISICLRGKFNFFLLLYVFFSREKKSQ